MTTIEKLAGITAQHNEIVKRVVNGSLDADEVREALQAIIEKREPNTLERDHRPLGRVALVNSDVRWPIPSWWRTPEQQLERARQLWPDIVLPKPPTTFIRQTKSEVLLLHVPDTFDGLWDKVVAPEGYTKSCREGVRFDKRHLRLAPNKRKLTQPVWLSFDPEHGRGKRPDELWGNADLAASEVLSALIQFPDWCLTWYNGAAEPYLAGYQLKLGTDWSAVPRIQKLRWGKNYELQLSGHWACYDSVGWASPSVTEY